MRDSRTIDPTIRPTASQSNAMATRSSPTSWASGLQPASRRCGSFAFRRRFPGSSRSQTHSPRAPLPREPARGSGHRRHAGDRELARPGTRTGPARARRRHPHRVGLVGELQARNAVWDAASPSSSTSRERCTASPRPSPRPVPLPAGPVERYADRAVVGSLGAVAWRSASRVTLGEPPTSCSPVSRKPRQWAATRLRRSSIAASPRTVSSRWTRPRCGDSIASTRWSSKRASRFPTRGRSPRSFRSATTSTRRVHAAGAPHVRSARSQRRPRARIMDARTAGPRHGLPHGAARAAASSARAAFRARALARRRAAGVRRDHRGTRRLAVELVASLKARDSRSFSPGAPTRSRSS